MTQTEQIRHSLLATLYGTRRVRVATGFLQRAVNKDCGASPDDVTAEIHFLHDAKLVDSEPDAVGSSDYWKLTAAGVLHYERNR